MYEVAFETINLVPVFGTLLGIYLILQIDSVMRSVVTFVKGWRTSN